MTALEPSILIKAVWIIAAILVLVVSFVIWKQPESKTKLSFKVSVLGDVARKELFGRWLEEEVLVGLYQKRGLGQMDMQRV